MRAVGGGDRVAWASLGPATPPRSGNEPGAFPCCASSDRSPFCPRRAAAREAGRARRPCARGRVPAAVASVAAVLVAGAGGAAGGLAAVSWGPPVPTPVPHSSGLLQLCSSHQLPPLRGWGRRPCGRVRTGSRRVLPPAALSSSTQSAQQSLRAGT